MKIVFIGSGNVATHLSTALKSSGHTVAQVYSRTLAHARELAGKMGTVAIDDLQQIDRLADLYIFSVKDDALSGLIARMPETEGLWVHTSGALSMELFAARRRAYGIFYPLQTFSKQREVDFREIPLFIEGSSYDVTDRLSQLGREISDRIYCLPEEKRRYLHVAAVFACNFVNHLYTLASDILEKADIPFEVLQPLIAETAAKVMEMSPWKAQTGPAVRCDEKVMRKHIEWLNDPLMKNIYSLLSENIRRHSERQQR